MKKLLFVAALTVSFPAAFAQPSNWYVSVSIGGGWGGPRGSIKDKFEKTGFNQTSSFNFFGLGSETTYPIVRWGVPVLVRAGKQLKGKRSVLAMAGVSAAGEVAGYKKEGSYNGSISGTFATHVTINYKVAELAVGMEHLVSKSRLRLGYAPAVFLLRYHNIHSNDAGKKTAVVPGLALTGRLPLGKEKRRIGAELVADVNLAPPATVKAQHRQEVDNNGVAKEVEVMTATRVNMVHGTAGLALTFRKK